MEQSASGFEGALLAVGFGDDFGAVGDLAAVSAAIAWYKYHSLGDGSGAASDAASAYGLAGLQTLA